MVIVGYNPILGLLPVVPVVYCVFFFLNPFLFARIFFFTLGFAAILNLPFTSGGFPVYIGIMFSGFLLLMASALVRKEPDFIKIFFKRTEHILISGFMILMFISLMNSRSLGISVKAIQLFIYCWLLYFFIQLVIRKREHLEKAIFWVVFSGFIIGVLGILELVLKISPYTFLGNKSLFMADVSEVVLDFKRGRINGLIGDPPFHGIYMVIIACLSLYKLLITAKKWDKVCFGVVFFVASANVVLTASRGAVIALVLALLVIWSYIELKRKWLILGGITSVCILLIFIVMLVQSQLVIGRLVTSEAMSGQTAEMRFMHIPVALNMFEDHPLIGTGPAGFVINYKKYATNVTNNAYKTTTMMTHNTPLQILAEYGLIGFIILGSLYILTLTRLWSFIHNASGRQPKHLALALMGALVGFSFFLFTSNNLEDRNLWMLIALSQCFLTLYAGDTARASAGKWAH